MAPRLRRPALITAALFAVLVGLGVWQLYRLQWKRGVLAAIDQAQAAPPIPLPTAPRRFQKVAVTGFLRPDLDILYGAEVRDTPQGPLMGAQLIQPLMRTDGPPLLVDRGWVPAPSSVPIPTPQGAVTLQGYVRLTEKPRLLTPHDDVAGRRFYTLDPAAMGQAIGLAQVAPFTLVLLGGAATAPPQPATDLPRPPNDHMSYAITWFGLAVALLVVFAVWARRAPEDVP